MITTTHCADSSTLAAALTAADNGDFHTLFLMVNCERVRLLDAQLIEQISAVKARNDQMAKLNDVLAKMNGFLGHIKGKGAGSKVDRHGGWVWEGVRRYEIPLNDAIRAAGLRSLGFRPKGGRVTPTNPGEVVKKGEYGYFVHGDANLCSCNTTRGELVKAVTKVKGLIDTESNNQQKDMFRLQRLNNKKNESVEMLTKGQKKDTDSIMGITQYI